MTGMGSGMGSTAGRLSIWQAAFVVARRDFVATLFSRSFIFFLLGPLFPILVGALAGGIGGKVAQSAAQPAIGVAMEQGDMDAIFQARDALSQKLGPSLPLLVKLRQLEPGETINAASILKRGNNNVSAVLSGTAEAPELTSTQQQVDRWQGPIAMIAAQATDTAQRVYPEVKTTTVVTSTANNRRGQIYTSQAALTLLFLLIMLLAGMVLSNLVEEKGNKIIEVLAAAIPMDAVFLGKLFAMLAVSMVGVAVWGSVWGTIIGLSGNEGPIADTISNLGTPGVGWPLFFLFGVIYFAMGYLLLGSVYLAIGSMAATVREVQTLAMPATMAQLLVFFFANYALTDTGGPTEFAAAAFPLSSPYTMLARAAMDDALWPHFLALAWQVVWVAIFIRLGAALFRRRVMKSGPQGVKAKRRGLLRMAADNLRRPA